MKKFKYDELRDDEKAILDEIEMINGVLNMGYTKGEVSKDYYEQTKVRLNKLTNMCKKRFDEVYRNESENI